MPKVNGLPTSHEFKKHLGRTGFFSRKFKKNDALIDVILQRALAAEQWRANSTLAALDPLRMLRKACIAWLTANLAEVRVAKPKIEDLCKTVHIRITTLIEFHFAKTTLEHERTKLKGAMSSVHDEIRLRRGGGVGRSLNPAYGVERNSNTHLPKPSGTQALARYNRVKADTKLDLENWIEQVLIPQTEEDPFRVFFGQNDVIAGAHLASLTNQRVKYCTMDERDSYLIKVTNGVITDASGNNFHTGTKETAHSGPGWAIYVIDFDKNFYSESHIVNEFHHSSFLAGAPVLCGGELSVNNGRLVALTNKTGHYHAGEAELLAALKLMRGNGVDLATIKVNDPNRAAGKWFNGDVALAAAGKLADIGDDLAVAAPIIIKV